MQPSDKVTDRTNIPVICLAGPYRDAPQLNTTRARRGAGTLYNLGYAVISPHLMTYDIAEWNERNRDEWGHDDPRWLPITRALVSRCDGLAYMPDSDESDGTQAEIAEARECNMPVASVVEYPSSERFWEWARGLKQEAKK